MMSSFIVWDVNLNDIKNKFKDVSDKLDKTIQQSLNKQAENIKLLMINKSPISNKNGEHFKDMWTVDKYHNQVYIGNKKQVKDKRGTPPLINILNYTTKSPLYGFVNKAQQEIESETVKNITEDIKHALNLKI